MTKEDNNMTSIHATNMIIIIRNMQLSDVPGVHSVQCHSYPPHLHETEEIFASKVKFCPKGCFVAEDSASKNIIGYMISHPWKDGVKMELHNSEMDISTPDIYYVHDTAILAQYRSLNLGTKLFAKALEQCKLSHFSKIKLVSLPPALNYWKRHGFTQDHEEYDKATSYGEVYHMSLHLLPTKRLADSC